ncbi:MAG: VWA domain-containing protein [SAR324 cluster bacterium]|nr:VWA domain-containing protein [SAR324 cluster bacterium]
MPFRFFLLFFAVILVSISHVPLFKGSTVVLAQTEFFSEDPEAPPPQETPQQPPPQVPSPVEREVVEVESQFEPGADVLFLMDVSGSMQAYLLDQKMNKLESAKAALSNVVQKMRDSARFQLWTFSATVTQHPGSSAKERPKNRGTFESIGGQAKQDLLDVIRKIEIPGELASVTNLYAAILQAMQYFQSHAYKPVKSGTAVDKIIVVLSDGKDDQVSPVNMGSILIAKDEFPDIQIRTIGFGIEKDDPFHRVLCTLATKNRCALAKDAKELQKVVSSFLSS